jgi:hypothetical protein
MASQPKLRKYQHLPVIIEEDHHEVSRFRCLLFFFKCVSGVHVTLKFIQVPTEHLNLLLHDHVHGHAGVRRF